MNDKSKKESSYKKLRTKQEFTYKTLYITTLYKYIDQLEQNRYILIFSM
tara:strand:+ start:50 stop:196 length:147 start_codon:yes stop_codon:yes gene_type:complete